MVGCPWPDSAEVHVPWCLHIDRKNHIHWRDKPTHQHIPKKGMGGKNPKSRIVAILCPPCHDLTDNSVHWDNAVVPGADGKLAYALWDCDVEDGWRHPLIERDLETGMPLEADSAAAEAGKVKTRGGQSAGSAQATGPVVPAADATEGLDVSAVAPSAPGEEVMPDVQPVRRRFKDSRVEEGGAVPESSAAERESPSRQPSGEDVLDYRSPLAAVPSLEDWCQRGMALVYHGLRLKGVTDEWRFQVGDWFNQGQDRLGEEAFGYTRVFGDETLRQYAWVAGSVVTRGTGLSWAHCREVAALPPPQQEELLGRALKEGLSTRALHRVIHGEPEEHTLVCPQCGHSAVRSAFSG